MEIGIIGAGFVGLSAAYHLAKSGHQVTVFEKEAQSAGLAMGFKEPEWQWSLEKHYHHFFVSDHHIRNLAAKIGHRVNFVRPITSTYLDGEIFQLDSPLSLLRFPKLTLSGRLRMGAVLAYLKLSPDWQSLKNIPASVFIPKFMGQKAWDIVWKPLFKGKFGKYYKQINSAWFWARIHPRSSSLGYPEGGFQALALHLQNVAQAAGAEFVFSTGISRVSPAGKNRLRISTDTQKYFDFDKVICSLTTPFFTRIVDLPADYLARLKPLIGLGAVNLILSLKQKFLPGVYWLNINEPGFPFLAVVEHTNYMSPEYYNGDRLVYIGNYLPPEHPYFQKDSPALLKVFTPYLKQINPDFSQNWVKKSWVWKAFFAQPIVTSGYYHQIPPMITPVKNLFLANMQQIYPWDRGTNYAVELGEKAARHASSA